ncbi:PAS domain-containing sensor histidine kinase, partial [Romboutsia sp.]|uniref:PAS domain-containing sensor histidine kinase n=1 Tax=Romboutsia sp. TaxID=1965302 RepID=UPI002B59CCBB
IFKINIIDVKNKNKKTKSKLSRSNIKIKIYDEKLKLNKNITSMINESLDKKQNILQTIVGEYNRCTFIVDSEGYILNEDNGFSKMWKEYSECKYKIILNTFLENSIKNANDFINSINKVKQKGIEIHGELEGNDGKILKCTYAPFTISNKNIGVICAMVDITYQKNSEIKIKENNTKYRKIVDNIPYSILITDANNILYNNNKNEKIDFDKNDIKNIIVETSTSGEMYYTCENDKEICLNIDRVSFDDGKSEKNLVVVRDITHYKKLLKDVEYSKKKYESLVNVIPEGIYISNYENRLINYSNQVFSELIDINSVDEIKSDHMNENMVINLGKNNNVKFTRKVITNKYGQEVDIECGSMLIEVNKRLKIIGIVRDITEQVKSENIEREIEVKKKENKIKTEFFVNMSHELKTPLNVISSSNQLLEVMNKDYINKNPDSEISKTVEIVKKHTYMLMGLINNVMDLAKLESQFYQSKADYYNIVSVVEDVCDEFNKYVKVNNIEILFDTDEEERIANVDPNDIEKIVLTLLSMVIRYSYPDSMIWVDLSSVKDKTIITIKNEGGYNYNRYINDQERRSLDIGITVAKLMIELYKGNIDINIGSKKDIKINIEIETNGEVNNYKKRIKSNGDDFIYTEYLRMCNF